MTTRTSHAATLHAFGLALAAVAGLAANPAAAQTQAAAEGDIGSIIVTARRRAENLQEVPLSIAAFNTQDLAATGANSLSDIAALTPGLNFEGYANGGYPVLTLRGLTQTSITAFENNVASFFGGVYLPRAYMVDVGLAGLERIEVVKGPQSALYGRNAFAGAVNYVPIAPPDKLLMEGFVTVGTFKRFDGSATLGAPLVADKLSFVGGFVHSQFDGTWYNQHPNRGIDAGGTTGRMGGWNNDAYFAAATLRPSERVRITVGYNRSEKNTEAQGRYGLARNSGQGNCSLVGGVYQFFCGQMPVLPTVVDPRSQGLKATSEIVRLDSEFQITDELRLKYLFGDVRSTAFSYDQTSINSVNGDSPAGVQFLGLPIGTISGPAHDLRLEFERGGTNLAAGAYYAELNDDYATKLVFQPALGTTPITPATTGQIIAQDGNTKIVNRSVFAQGAQDFLDGRFNVGAEARYTEEKKTLFDRVVNAVYRAKFKNFTPRFVVKWNVSEDGNVYASAAKGVKSGGFNSGSILDSERTFGPESNWTYELGTKYRLFQRRLVLDAALFYVDWSGLQTLGQSANPAFVGTITRNIGTATAKGVEASATALVATGLKVNAGVSYTDPKYGSPLTDPRYLLLRSAANQPILVCDNVTCPANGSIGGNTLPRESKFQATSGVRYDGEFAALGGLAYWLGADLAYKSRQFVDPLLLTWVPSRTLVNLNLGVTRNGISLELWARNLFDEKYVSSVSYNLSPNTNIRYEAVMGDRRTGGITLRYRY